MNQGIVKIWFGVVFKSVICLGDEKLWHSYWSSRTHATSVTVKARFQGWWVLNVVLNLVFIFVIFLVWNKK